MDGRTEGLSSGTLFFCVSCTPVHLARGMLARVEFNQFPERMGRAFVQLPHPPRSASARCPTGMLSDPDVSCSFTCAFVLPRRRRAAHGAHVVSVRFIATLPSSPLPHPPPCLNRYTGYPVGDRRWTSCSKTTRGSASSLWTVTALCTAHFRGGERRRVGGLYCA